MNNTTAFVGNYPPADKEDYSALLVALKEATTDHPLYKVYDILDLFDKWLEQANELRTQVDSIKKSIANYTDIGVRHPEVWDGNILAKSLAEGENIKPMDPEVETVAAVLEDLDPAKEVAEKIKEGTPVPAPEDITLPESTEPPIEEGTEPIATAETVLPDSVEIFEKLQKAYLAGKLDVKKIHELLNLD